MSWFSRKISWVDLVSKEFRSPEEICKFVRKHIKYRKESQDHWFMGAETWNRGHGDCEDLAVLIWELCSLNGFESNVVVSFSGNFKQSTGHAYVTGPTWFSSNGEYQETTKPIEVMHRKLSWEKAFARILEPDMVHKLCLRQKVL